MAFKIHKTQQQTRKRQSKQKLDINTDEKKKKQMEQYKTLCNTGTIKHQKTKSTTWLFPLQKLKINDPVWVLQVPVLIPICNFVCHSEEFYTRVTNLLLHLLCKK